MEKWIDMSLICLFGITATATEQELPKKEKDRQAILAMAGSFEVSFHFEETVSFLPGYELTPAYDADALEEVIVVEDGQDRIVLQHVLLTRKGIVKHWRQDWEYQNDWLLEYQGNNRWAKRQLGADEVEGTWTQRVFQVDDSPRYESLGRWTHLENLSQWESQSTNRPLPRREYTKRDDYQILVARNRQTLTPNGWVHEQDNFKLALDGKDSRVIARELGWNRYIRTDPERCAEVRDWWEANRDFWTGIRNLWGRTIQDRRELALQKKVDGQPLYKHLFQLNDDAAASEAAKLAEYLVRAEEIIARFLENGKTSAGPREGIYD